MSIHQIFLIIIAFFMFVTSILAMVKNSDQDNRNLTGYYIFSLVLGVLGIASAFIGGGGGGGNTSFN